MGMSVTLILRLIHGRVEVSTCPVVEIRLEVDRSGNASIGQRGPSWGIT